MKKLLASLLAMSMVFAFTACSLTGDSDDDDSSSKKSKDSSSTSAVDDSEGGNKADDGGLKVDDSGLKADDGSSEATLVVDDSSSEAEADSSEAEPAVIDDSSEADKPAGGSGNVQGNGYTIDVDSSWKDITSTVSGVDKAFSYVGDTSNAYLSTANFNIIAQGGAGNTKVADYVDLIKKQYETLGYKISNSEQTTFNGYDAYRVETTVAQANVTMKMHQLILIENETAFIISYGSEESVFDTVKPEFDKVLGTFKVS